jgi:hypothetical protein
MSRGLRFSSELDLERLRYERRERSNRAAVPSVPERAVLAAVLVALRLHKKVAWVERMNSGKFKLPGKDGKGQWVRFGFVGMADVTGQLKAEYGGKRLEVECKREGENPTPEQEAFLANVCAAGGIGLVVHSIDELMRGLA